MENTQVKTEVLQDETNYVAVYQDFSLSLLDYINSQEPYENALLFKEFFNSPGVFDGLVNILVQELRQKPIRPYLCDPQARRVVIDQLVHTVMDMCDKQNLVLHEFAEVVERLPLIKLRLEKKHLGEGYREL
jgi:hypothetical protein